MTELLLGSCSRIVSAFRGSDTLFNLFGFIRGVAGKIIRVNNRVVFNFSRFLDNLVAFLSGILLNRISLSLRLLGYSLRFFIRFRLDAGGLAAETVRLVRRLFFYRVDVFIGLILNCLGFIGRRLFNLLRIIFSFIQIGINFYESSQPARNKHTAEAISVLLQSFIVIPLFIRIPVAGRALQQDCQDNSHDNCAMKLFSPNT